MVIFYDLLIAEHNILDQISKCAGIIQFVATQNRSSLNYNINVHFFYNIQ